MEKGGTMLESAEIVDVSRHRFHQMNLKIEVTCVRIHIVFLSSGIADQKEGVRIMRDVIVTEQGGMLRDIDDADNADNADQLSSLYDMVDAGVVSAEDMRLAESFAAAAWQTADFCHQRQCQREYTA
jgi:hypothetical protein